jgi:adenylate kinase
MRILLMGPPGAGKGTQAKIIGNKYSVPQISTGDILRDAMKRGTEMGRKAQEFVNAGKLVPDEVVIGIVKDRLNEPDTNKGFILDGFPRTTGQADALKALLGSLGKDLNRAVTITVPDEELIRRLLERAVIEGRADDTEAVIKNRLQTYNDQTRPLIEYYKGENILREINGLGSMEEITSRIEHALEQ